MYSGTTLHNKSGNLMGAHQKFDRVARKKLAELRPDSNFPDARLILHFEGNNGPDGVKRKSAGTDEPWHFWDPTNPEDTVLITVIAEHYNKLVEALSHQNEEKAAFEAAWLAHAVVDGLTPAHHYPYEAKLTELRGEGNETRTSFKKKVVITGDTKRQTLQKNWQMWGAKGLLMSHAFFEFGVSSISRPLKFKKLHFTNPDVRHVKNIGIEAFMKELALEIYELNMYERFLKRGWTLKLSKDTRRHLAPKIVTAITLLWVLAYDEARSK